MGNSGLIIGGVFVGLLLTPAVHAAEFVAGPVGRLDGGAAVQKGYARVVKKLRRA